MEIVLWERSVAYYVMGEQMGHCLHVVGPYYHGIQTGKEEETLGLIITSTIKTFVICSNVALEFTRKFII